MTLALSGRALASFALLIGRHSPVLLGGSADALKAAATIMIAAKSGAAGVLIVRFILSVFPFLLVVSLSYRQAFCPIMGPFYQKDDFRSTHPTGNTPHFSVPR